MTHDRENLKLFLDHMDLFENVANQQELSTLDKRRSSCRWTVTMRNREHEWFQYRDGILDETIWQSYRRILPLITSSRRHRAWWQKTKSAFDPGFVEIVDNLIGELPESDIWEEYFTVWEQAA